MIDWNKPENPPAFPVGTTRPGMTLRDWFSGQALAVAWEARDKGYYEGDDADMARAAYSVADAMLEERNRK